LRAHLLPFVDLLQVPDLARGHPCLIEYAQPVFGGFFREDGVDRLDELAVVVDPIPVRCEAWLIGVDADRSLVPPTESLGPAGELDRCGRGVEQPVGRDGWVVRSG